MTIKIQCGCGQRYAFDVEPVNGRVASPVACPACGADGTVAANAIIAQSAQPQAAVASATEVRLRAAIPAVNVRPVSAAPAPAPGALLPGQIEPDKAEAEARCKIFWGDPPDDALKFLMANGFSYEDASALVQGMFQERTAALRGIGTRKILMGVALMAVPVVTYIILAYCGVLFIKLLAIAFAVGVWGGYFFLKGLFLVLDPTSHTGDLADQ